MLIVRPPFSTVYNGRLADRAPDPPSGFDAISDFNLLRKFQRVVQLDTEIADRALQLSMAKQQLTGVVSRT